MKSHGYALHVHHRGRVLELLTQPLAARQRYIRNNKPERQQPLRLRLLRKVPTRLVPAAIRQADAAWQQAQAALQQAQAALQRANAALEHTPAVWQQAYEADKTWQQAEEARRLAYEDQRHQLAALHTKLCLPDCPWDGATIFPAGQKLEA